MAALDPLRIQDGLQRLRSTRTTQPIFGAESHNFVLNQTLSEHELVAFEKQHRIEFPNDYREFLIHVGNGGAGPYYGVFPFGHMDANHGMKRWHENDGFIGMLSEPFLLTSDWNDLTGMPSDDLLELDDAEYQKQLEEFDNRYWRASRMNGAVPICHQGCALRIWLVATGEQAGCLWHDGRADYTGLKPLSTGAGNPATFSLWYNEWLDNALRAATP